MSGCASLDLLSRLLDGYERSSSFSQPGPWRRDIMIKFDASAFTDAFAPSGREQHEDIMRAALHLEREGAIRITRHERGPLTGEPKEFRLGPGELSRAYARAAELGYEALSLGLGHVERYARDLASQSLSQPAKEFLETLAKKLPVGDLALIGMGRSRFKQEWRALTPALTASVALMEGITPTWERVVSEKLFHDSKVLGRLRPHVTNLLLRMDPRWDGVPVEDAVDLLEAYGVRRKPGLIRCAGKGAVGVAGREYRIEDFTPVAHLPDAWSDAWVEAVVASGSRVVTTIENEFPFLSYVEQSGGSSRLGARREIVVYSAGFPTPALTTALVELRRRISDAEFRHWGDADVGGLRIWWFLRCRLNCPISLFRTTASWVKSESYRGARRLSAPEMDSLRRLRAQLDSASGEDIDCATELIDELIEHQIAIEQERY